MRAQWLPMSAANRYRQPWADAGGVTHPPADQAVPPERMVSLVPSLTECVVALGARDRLSGITAFCIRPADLLKDPALTKVGGTKKFSREKLMALKPGLVLVNLEENELDDIGWLRARVPCYINGVRTLDEGLETLRELGALLGRLDQGDAIAAACAADLAAARARLADFRARGGRPRRVCYPIWRDPWMIPGPDTFIARHFEALGAQLVPDLPGPSRYPEMSLEQLAAARPDTIWLPDEPFKFQEADAAELRARPDLAGVPVRLVSGDEVCWFGVRQREGLPYAYRTLWGQGIDDGPLPLS